jgi:hypothetical protein
MMVSLIRCKATQKENLRWSGFVVCDAPSLQQHSDPVKWRDDKNFSGVRPAGYKVVAIVTGISKPDAGLFGDETGCLCSSQPAYLYISTAIGPEEMGRRYIVIFEDNGAIRLTDEFFAEVPIHAVMVYDQSERGPIRLSGLRHAKLVSLRIPFADDCRLDA